MMVCFGCYERLFHVLSCANLFRFISSACPWSVSGPQLQTNATALQQRYCYPKGTGEYSEDKGGAVWTLVSNGVENIDTRILNVYESSRRRRGAHTTGKPKTSSNSSNKKGTRQSKRNNALKSNTHLNKKSKVSETKTAAVTKCPSQDNVTQAPGSSFDLDPNLKYNSWDTASSTNQGLSFMPVKSEDMNDIVWNNPAFNSMALRPLPKDAHKPAYTGAIGASSYHWQFSSYGYGNWAKTAQSIHRIPSKTSSKETSRDGKKEKTTKSTSIPNLTSSETSSEQKASKTEKTEEATLMDLQEFSSKLKSMEEALYADVREGESDEQVQKLQLLQKWAKGIAQKPHEPSTTT